MKKFIIFIFLGFIFVNVASAASSFSLNLGTAETDKASVLIYFNAPKDTAYMRISNTADFAGSQQKAYAAATLWDICSGLVSCPLGMHNVYVKLVSSTGAEETISNSINYVAAKPSVSGSSIFTRTLKLGSQGADVRALQIYLNAHGFIVASFGPGSPGAESTYFGVKTQLALKKFQEAHRAEILTPLGLFSGTGALGFKTIAFISAHP